MGRIQQQVGKSFEKKILDYYAVKGYWSYKFPTEFGGTICDILLAKNGGCMFIECKHTTGTKLYYKGCGIYKKRDELDNFVIKKFKLAFGNRILKHLETFVPNYVACGGTETDAFDFIFTNKILKKFESLNIAFLKEELQELSVYLDKLYGKGKFPKAQSYIETMIKNN